MDTELINELSTLFSVKQFLQLVAILVGALVLQLIAKSLIRILIYSSLSKPRKNTSHEEKQRKDTLVGIIHTTFLIALWITAFLLAIGIFGISVGPLLAGAGIAGVALGFGAQTMIKDFLAGVFIIGENQYRIGDVIIINNQTSGTVETLSLRMTSLRDLEGRVHYIPNGTIQVATNMTMEYANIELDIKVSLDTDIDKAEKIIEKVGIDMQKDEELSKAILEAPYLLRLDNFDDSALMLKILCKTEPGKQWSVKGQFLRRLKKAFDKEGIKIALPQVVVHQPVAVKKH